MPFPIMQAPNPDAVAAILSTTGAMQQQATQRQQQALMRAQTKKLILTNPYAAQLTQAHIQNLAHPRTPLSNALALKAYYDSLPANHPDKAYVGNLLMKNQMGTQWMAKNVEAASGPMQGPSPQSPGMGQAGMPPQGQPQGMPEQFSQPVGLASAGQVMGYPPQQPQEMPQQVGVSQQGAPGGRPPMPPQGIHPSQQIGQGQIDPRRYR